MKKLFVVALLVLFCLAAVNTQELDHFLFVPAVQKDADPLHTPVPTRTPTLTPTLTRTPSWGSTPTPFFGPTPTLVGTPDPQGVFALSNAIAFHRSPHMGDDCVVVGEIRNDTTEPVKNIHYTVYPVQNGTPWPAVSDILYWTIPPENKVCFKLTVRSSCQDDPPEVTAQVTSYVIGDLDQIRNLTFTSIRVFRTWSGTGIHVVGRVYNNETWAVKNVLHKATLYDGSKNLLGCDPYSGDFAIEIGGSIEIPSTYFSLMHYSEALVSLRFVANGDLDPDPTPTPTRVPDITVVPYKK